MSANHEPKPADHDPVFRETEPIELWSSLIEIDLPFAEFERLTAQAAREHGQRFTGYITYGANDHVASFTRTRYPRKKYGVSTPNECEAGMFGLADKMDTTLLRDPRIGGFRVVFGLIEGYDENAPIHSTEEVQRALPNCAVTPAEVFVVWPSEDDNPTYREPVAIIDGPIEAVRQVYDLADKLKQERITIEDFERNIVFVVETRHCTEPDE
jgi:hypothetical protein